MVLDGRSFAGFIEQLCTHTLYFRLYHSIYCVLDDAVYTRFAHHFLPTTALTFLAEVRIVVDKFSERRIFISCQFVKALQNIAPSVGNWRTSVDSSVFYL